jgi:CBS domain-containing protein
MNTEQQAFPAEESEPTALALADHHVIAVGASMNAMAALRVMYRNAVHHLPVLSEGVCIGLISATDLLFAIAGASPEALVTVAGLCRRPVPHVASTATSSQAADKMVESGTDALVVTTGGEVLGVLTATDLVRAVARGVHPLPTAGKRGADFGR